MCRFKERFKKLDFTFSELSSNMVHLLVDKGNIRMCMMAVPVHMELTPAAVEEDMSHD